MKLFSRSLILALANAAIHDEAVAKAILLLSNSQAAWNDNINHVMQNIKQADQSNSTPKKSIPWFFGGGYHHTSEQAPDVHSVHPDETKKSVFGFSWGKSDLADRHDPAKQLADHRIPGSFARGMHASLLPNIRPDQLAASFTGDISHAIFGRKTNSWFDLLNIGGGKLDELLAKADEEKRKIEELIATAGLSEVTKHKLLGAFNNYNDVILQDMLYTGFLAREYIPEKGGLGDPSNLNIGSLGKLKNFLNNIVANKELPIEQAIHSIEHRIGGLEVVEDLFNKLPDTKEKKEIGKAIETLRKELTGSLGTFTKELAAVAAQSLTSGVKEAKVAASKWAPRRRLQAVDHIEDSEKDFQGVFANIVSTALQAKDSLTDPSSAGLNLDTLQNFGNKLIKSTVHDSLLNQIGAMTGIPQKTLKDVFEKTTGGNSTQTVDQVKNLVTTLLNGVDETTADSSKDVKSQMSSIADLLKKKMGGSQALFDMLKKQLGPDTANAILGDTNKTLLTIAETLKEMNLTPMAESTDAENSILAEGSSTENTSDEPEIATVSVVEEDQTAQAAVLVQPDLAITETVTTEIGLDSTEESDSTSISFVDDVATEYKKALESTVDSAKASADFIDKVGDEIVDAGQEMAAEAENGLDAVMDTLSGKLLLSVETASTEDTAEAESTFGEDITTSISEEQAAANSEELQDIKSTIHAQVDEAVTNLGNFVHGAGDVLGNAVGSVAQGVGESVASLFVGENKQLLTASVAAPLLDAASTAAEALVTRLEEMTTDSLLDENSTFPAEVASKTDLPEQVATAAALLVPSSVTPDLPEYQGHLPRALAPVTLPPELTGAKPNTRASVVTPISPSSSRIHAAAATRAAPGLSQTAKSTNLEDIADELRPDRFHGSRHVPAADWSATLLSSSPYYRAINGQANLYQVATRLPVFDNSITDHPQYAPGYYGYRVNMQQPRFALGAVVVPPSHLERQLILQKQFKDLQIGGGAEGYSVGLEDGNWQRWRVALTGPPDSPFDGGVFSALLIFPDDFPNNPPQMRFTPPLYHPNIYPTGEVCISILHPPGTDQFNEQEKAEERWRPIISVEAIIMSVISMLGEPNPDSPANIDAAKLLRTNPKEYCRKVRRLVEEM